MLLKRFAVWACIAALSVMPAIAATEPTADNAELARPSFNAEPVFRDLNLLGNWARDCAAPASPQNPHVATTAPGDGRVVEVHDVGPEYASNLYHFIAARRLDKDSIEAQALFRPGLEGEEPQTLVMRIGKDARGTDTRRTIYNRGDDGVRVRNGVALRSGLKTPVLRRCG
ncbi:MAG: hypothetical protein JSR61_08440 [Proteobacteria bacterium]|nr:hypothetical protein [Pseudomonadota bacterium]